MFILNARIVLTGDVNTCVFNKQDRVPSKASQLTSLLINWWSRFPDHEHWMLLIIGSCH